MSGNDDAHPNNGQNETELNNENAATGSNGGGEGGKGETTENAANVLKGSIAPGAGEENKKENSAGENLTPLEIAKSYIAKGWNPVPIKHRNKRPIGDEWQKCKIDLGNVNEFFDNPKLNVGVQLGSASGGLTDLDLDCEEAVKIASHFLPKTKAVFGRASKRASHWLYVTTLAAPGAKASMPFRNPVTKSMMFEVRIGGKGAQTVMPGSTHVSGEAIEWAKGCDGTPAVIDDGVLIKCARRYAAAVLLAQQWPKGNGQHEALLALGGTLARAKMTSDEAEEFAAHVVVGAGRIDIIDEARRIARDAVEAFAQGTVVAGLTKATELFGGAEATQSKFAKDLGRWLEYPGFDGDDHDGGGGFVPPAGGINSAGGGNDPVAAMVADMNKRYALVVDSNKVAVWYSRYDEETARTQYEELSPEAFNLMFQNKFMTVGTGNRQKTVTYSKLWLAHPERREYLEGVGFDPTGKLPPGKMNLWRGFRYTPKKGSWEKLREHIRVVCCRGDQQHFDYVMDWSANSVQNPSDPGETAIVLKGGQGSGKGMLARALARLFGQHGMQISNPAHLVGKFNEHLQDCVLLFADEAFYAGDKEHESILKAIITEYAIVIEGKNKKAKQRKNRLSIIMASNRDWVVPASLDSRRFFVLDVSDERVGDFAYFTAINEELENGGYEAMLEELMTRDISKFNPHEIPKTDGLNTQKLLSLDVPHQWFQDVLMRGYVWKSTLGLDDTFDCWFEVVSTELLYASYIEFTKGQRFKMNRATFGRFMTGFGFAKKKDTNALVGEYKLGVEAKIRSKPTRAYALGTLAAAREVFEKKTSLKIEWEDADVEGAM